MILNSAFSHLFRLSFTLSLVINTEAHFQLRMWSTLLLRTIDNIIAGSLNYLLLLLLLFVQFRQHALFSLMLITFVLVTSHCVLNEHFTPIFHLLCCDVMMRNVMAVPLKSTSDWHAMPLFPYSTLSLR